MSIYNTIQKSVVGVKDANLRKGPHMTALKLAALESSKAVKKNMKNKERADVGFRRGRSWREQEK